MKTIDPKGDFLRRPDSGNLSEHLNSPIMQQALRVAMEQFVYDKQRQETLDGAAKAQFELQGARRYLEILINLTTQEPTPTPDKTGQLQWHKKPSRQPPPPPPRQPQP